MSSRGRTAGNDRLPGHRYDIVKRALDFAGALTGLVVLSPVLACVAVAVAVRLGRPVLFVQERPGRSGVAFRLVKFRTMRGVDVSGGRVADEERLTRFGRALRSTSLDELPELWHVLRGDMSFVGPRPLLMAYLDRYTAVQARRHEVRPGITGLAQVSGRNTVEWGARFALDVEYVDARSFELDARILWRTVVAVLRRDGTTAEGHVTMPEFTGERGQHES
jgi:lipopolysaccharide/colanic/teichoic acid biosynthesis glycosyltransferase